MSQTTLAELSLSLSHVQSLLKQITAEVQVLSEGIAVLVEQEEAEDVEEELSYLDVDPWSNVNNDRDKNAATAATAGRRDSIRSLMQRKPSTVKDETKALARILSQKKRAAGGVEGNGSAGNGSGSETEKQPPSTLQSKHHQGGQQHQGNGRWSNSILQDQVIDEDYTSSEGGSSKRGSPTGDKQELMVGTIASSYSATSTLPPPETERVPHTITVQTTPMPTKFSIAITKPLSKPQSPSTPVLSTSSTRGSILEAMSNSTSNHNNTHNATTGPPPFWRSSTAPNIIGDGSLNSRPNSVIGNLNSDGGSIRTSLQNIAQRRSLQPEPRSASDHQIITQNSVKDRYTQALRSSSSNAVLHPAVGKDTVKSIFTINSPKPMVASQVDKMESTDCFSKLELTPELLRGIYAYGLKMPSILQQRGIPMIMTRHDVLTQARPEVAKTLTYAIPLLNFLTLPATSIHPQLLILCSNHDLCLHVQRVLLALARFMPTISCLICAEGNNATLSLGTMSTTQVNIGGNNAVKNGYGARGAASNAESATQVIAAHVVIGTPGKVLNLIRTKQISLSALKVMVLENADILLASPLKEATVSLLSMVRDPATTSNGSVNGSAQAGGGGVEQPISPPNSGPTSPVSAAVAALNGRIIGSNSGSTGASAGRLARFPGAYGESDSTPRSVTGSASAVVGAPSTPTSPLGTIRSPSTTANGQPQLLFFSTEVPSHVLDHVAQYMTQPTKALVKGHELALKGILQFFKYMTVDDEEWQAELLCDLLEDSGANRVVVFCNSDESVEKVVIKIRERKGFAIGMYSDMDVASRKAAIGRFRGSAPPVYLVTTDEAAKDLEILAVPLVVSFEIPSIGNYIPRVKWIDRSKGKVGAKVTLVDGHRGEGQALRAIQQHYRTTIDDMPVSIAEFIVN